MRLHLKVAFELFHWKKTVDKNFRDVYAKSAGGEYLPIRLDSNYIQPKPSCLSSMRSAHQFFYICIYKIRRPLPNA